MLCGLVLVGGSSDGTRKRASVVALVWWWQWSEGRQARSPYIPTPPKQVRAHFATFLQECRPPGNEDPAEPPLYLFRLTQVGASVCRARLWVCMCIGRAGRY